MSKTEEQMYQEMAELKLQNRLLEERLKMMTGIATDYINMRADLCRQLEDVGYRIAINNQLVRCPRQVSEEDRLRTEYGVFN